MAMNPTLKWGLIIGGSLLFIFLLMLGVGTAKAQQLEAEDDLQDTINDDEDEGLSTLTNAECRALCKGLCKVKPLLFGGRQKCIKNCKNDCKSGKDVTTLYP